MEPQSDSSEDDAPKSTILTWNMEGGSGTYGSKWSQLTTYLNDPDTTPPDVICLQECTEVPGLEGGEEESKITYGTKTFGSSSRSSLIYNVAFYNAEFGTAKVNMAILTLRTSGTSGVPYEYVKSIDGGRDLVGMTVASSIFFTVHAPPVYGNQTVADTQRYLEHIIASTKSLADQKGFIIGGDFNIVPTDLQAIGLPAGVQVYDSGQATHDGGNEYDYFVGTIPVNNITPVAQGTLVSDHQALIGEF